MIRIGVALAAVRDRRWSEMLDVVEAQLALLRAQTMRWVRPLGEFVEVAPDEPLSLARASLAQRELCDRLASAINRATRYGLFRPLCLTRAVALSRMLDAHGIAGHRIRIGVRRDAGFHDLRGPHGYRLSGIARHRLHRGPRHTGDRLEWDQ